MAKRPSSIGQSPLDSVVPTRTPTSPANRKMGAQHAIPVKRGKVTVASPVDLVARLRAAAYRIGKSLAAVVETAIGAQLDQEEEQNGGPFEPLSTKLQPGLKVEP